MSQHDTPTRNSSACLPIARLTINVAAAPNPRDTADLVELDRENLASAAEATVALSRAGWALTLNVDGPYVDLVAQKPHAGVTAAAAELFALGVTSGRLYLDTPDGAATTHELDMSDPKRVLVVSRPSTRTDRRCGTTTVAPSSDAAFRLRAGTLVLANVPTDVDEELLLAALEHSTLGDVVADVAASLPGSAAVTDSSEGRSEPAQ